MSAANDQTETPPPVPSAATSGEDAAAVSLRTNWLFSVSLAIVATLPIGIGVGIACRSRMMTDVSSAAAAVHNESALLDRSSDVRLRTRNRPDAEELFRAGDFLSALRAYESKQCEDSLPLSSAEQLKLAACHEALGQWDEALDILKTLAEQPTSESRNEARLALSRVRLRLREFAAARSMLSELARPDAWTESAAMVGKDIAGDLMAIAELLDTETSLEPADFAHSIATLEPSLWNSPDLLVGREACQFGDHVRLARGERAIRRGDFEQAADEYRALVTNTATPKSVVAAFNLGIAQFRRRDYHEASRSLGRFIDGRTHDAETSRALWLRGRALLELGDGELAALDFKRAADLPGSPELRAWSAALLGMAQLQANRPDLAARDLFLRRELFYPGMARTEAGFVVALARVESLRSDESWDREALFMLRALESLNPETEWLGTCGRMLIGRAYERLGMLDQAIDAYERALHADMQDPFASEMRLALADCLRDVGREDDARSLLEEMQHSESKPWAKQAALRLAEWELTQHRPDECLAICRELLPGEPSPAPILRLMGQAYELAGQHGQAAQCFAGLLMP